MLVLFAGICAFSLAVAVACVLMGAWPVLPFAGLEMLALGVCLYRLHRRGQGCEIVAVEGGTVEVHTRHGGQSHVFSFQRPWAHVVLRMDHTGWYPSRLLIRSHGREVEVGRWLNEEERRRLARDLVQVIPKRHAPA
jgi:uncharacterized membrane protein